MKLEEFQAAAKRASAGGPAECLSHRGLAGCCPLAPGRSDLTIDIGRLRHFQEVLREAESVSVASADKQSGYCNISFERFPDLRPMLLNIVSDEYAELLVRAKRIGLDPE